MTHNVTPLMAAAHCGRCECAELLLGAADEQMQVTFKKKRQDGTRCSRPASQKAVQKAVGIGSVS
jgi:hypothetical protein